MSSTPTLRTYEGRVLPHQDEEVVDQGLAFDVATLMSRRTMLGAFGAGAAGLSLAACTAVTDTGSSGGGTAGSTTSSTDALTEIPEETAGPYPGDGSNGPDVLQESGIVRSDITTSIGESSGVAEGVPMTLDLTIMDLANDGAPFEGVAVYVWHCTREGGYSMYSEGVTEENFLRGVQIADEAGLVSYTSIFPACYDGRWPHIHFEVYPDPESITDVANVIATSQVALPQDVCETVYAEAGYEASIDNLARVSLDSDNVFSDDGGASQLATVTGDVAAGYTVTLTVGVDATTDAGGGAQAGRNDGGRSPDGPGDAPPVREDA